MAEKKFTPMSEDEFYEKYHPVKNPYDNNASFDGCMFETYGNELLHVVATKDDPEKKNKVWTITESEDKLYYESGYHYVNRLGYLITEEAFPEDLDIVVELETI
jgi:hypothetical protein